jgi:uncharacterized protein YlzI (FlbEa/FlbD family)
MADSNSTIRLTNGQVIVVPMSLDELQHEIDGYFARRRAPFMKIKREDGTVFLINVNQIAEIE